MARVLFVVQDPGGANCLLPLVVSLADRAVLTVIARGSASDVFTRAHIKVEDFRLLDMDPDEGLIFEFLEKKHPDIIITSASGDIFERLFWRPARDLGIPTIAVLDSWINVLIRFSKYPIQKNIEFEDNNEISYLPDYIFTMSEYEKSILVEAGVSEDKIYVTGNAYFQEVKRRIINIDDTEMARYRKTVLNGRKKIILYASDNIYECGLTSNIGYDQRTSFDLLVKSLLRFKDLLRDHALIIRPHPKESIDWWTRKAKECNDEGIFSIVDNLESPEMSIATSDLIVGMVTMFLVEAALVGKPLISIQIGSKKRGEFILERSGVITPVYTEEELNNSIHSYLSGELVPKRFEGNDGALSRQIGVIERIVNIDVRN